MAKIVDLSNMTAKEKHKINLLEYLSNPDNKVIMRSELAEKVLGITKSALYKFFNTDELSEIEGEALKKRRARLALKISQVDDALVERATIDKDVKAIELFYKRLEGWNPNQKIELSENADPESIEISFTVQDGSKKD